jgi:hypothetical protein
MSSFSETNQAKLTLKMSLSKYCWYDSISVTTDNDDWCILVSVSKLDSSVKKLIPTTCNGIPVKIDTGGKKLL